MKRRSLSRVANDSAPRIDGEPYYALHECSVANRRFLVRCFDVLPPCDAVGLLVGDDQTGLIVWEGTLRLLEFIFEQQLLTEKLRKPVPLFIVELGAGCGIGSTGCASEIIACRRDGASTNANAVSILATDGNSDCVSLSTTNLAAYHSDNCSVAGDMYEWGEPAAKLIAYQPAVTTQVLVISGDVIYCPEAVAPLLSAVRNIADSTSTDNQVEWLLSWVPRCLTRSANEECFARLLAGLQQQSWVLLSACTFPVEGEEHSDTSNNDWFQRTTTEFPLPQSCTTGWIFWLRIS